jgi:hypothetical protein
MKKLNLTIDRLRPKEAARMAGVSVGTIYNRMDEDLFKNWQMKRRGFERGIRFIDRASFEKFLAEQAQGATA